MWTDSYQNTRFYAVIWQSVTGKYIRPAIVCKNWPVCLYARKGKLIVLQLNRLATHVEFNVAYLCSIECLLFTSFFSPVGFTDSHGYWLRMLGHFTYQSERNQSLLPPLLQMLYVDWVSADLNLTLRGSSGHSGFLPHQKLTPSLFQFDWIQDEGHKFISLWLFSATLFK